MSDKDLKETINTVASIDVHSETQAIAKELLMNYAEHLQEENKILSRELSRKITNNITLKKDRDYWQTIVIELEKWLNENNTINLDENFIVVKLVDIKDKLQELKEGEGNGFMDKKSR